MTRPVVDDEAYGPPAVNVADGSVDLDLDGYGYEWLRVRRPGFRIPS
jgi:hypothetical protein